MLETFLCFHSGSLRSHAFQHNNKHGVSDSHQNILVWSGYGMKAYDVTTLLKLKFESNHCLDWRTPESQSYISTSFSHTEER